jgi:hypothetical protein
MMDQRWPDVVRERLFAVWGRQACRVRPSDWPEVRERLLKDGVGGAQRTAMKPHVDRAVDELAAMFWDGPATADATMLVWTAFCKLDKAHCTELAQELVARRANW